MPKIIDDVKSCGGCPFRECTVINGFSYHHCIPADHEDVEQYIATGSERPNFCPLPVLVTATKRYDR